MTNQPRRGEGPFILEDSDGCSALSGPYRCLTKIVYGEERKLPFLKYCIEHDESYWYGGNKQQRFDADIKLFRGVVRSAPNKLVVIPYMALSGTMLLVVRVMGSPHIPSPFRWMYRDEYTPELTYTIERVEKNETVATYKDAEVVHTLMENPWTEASVAESVKTFKEGDKHNEVFPPYET